jgi:hypothetical protein
MLRYLLIVGIALFSVACQTKQGGKESASRLYSNGVEKPTVALVPVIDSSGYELPWNMAEELTSLINARLNTQGIFLVTPKEGALPYLESPFTNNILWIKKNFKDYDFVVFLELIEHEKVAEKKGCLDSSSNLNTAMRIRIVDNRDKQPKVVLQELLKDSYFISKSLLPVDYNVVAWNTSDYSSTPFGIAHLQLCKSVVERLSDYIAISQRGKND